MILCHCEEFLNKKISSIDEKAQRTNRQFARIKENKVAKIIGLMYSPVRLKLNKARLMY